MTKKQKRMRRRILLAAGLLLAAVFAARGMERCAAAAALSLLLHLTAYLLVGWDVLRRAVRNIRTGQVFDENFLMAVATVGAFGCGEQTEGVAVMLFYQVGELFQSVAVARSRRSIAALMDIRPEYANVEREGRLEEVEPEAVAVGDIIVVKPGERVALDGTVEEGRSSLDTAALTGEPLPRTVEQGDAVVSGCVNLTGLLRIRVSRPYEESTVARILELVEASAEKKAKVEHFITRFARWYTPCVVAAALLLVTVPPLMGMGSFLEWLHRGLIFLVVSCPCALVISIPLSFFGGIGGASRRGILVKGGNYLEALAGVGVVVFDKTGTLTHGQFAVTQVCPRKMEKQVLLELAALAEGYSDHPISASIRRSVSPMPSLSRLSQVEERAGLGVRATIDGRSVWVGSEGLMTLAGVESLPPVPAGGTIVHIAVDGTYAGYLVVEDRVREQAGTALQTLKRAGVRKTVMLTGDRPEMAEAVGQRLGLDEVHAGLLPGDKVDRVERLLEEKRPGEQLVFVGDGINDAPVLSRADIGVAMGALGSDAAIEAADIVLMTDDLALLPEAVRIARKTIGIVKENIVFALGVKFLVLFLSAFGLANMWMAVFADVGVSVIAILNAGRMLKRGRTVPDR